MALGSAVWEEPFIAEGISACSDVGSGLGAGRTGRGLRRFGSAAAGWRLVAFEMAAFKTWLRVGFIPHAKQGGSGV